MAAAWSFRAASSSVWRWPARSSSSPKLLLLDEPLANLDARLRDDVRWLIRDVQQASRTTAFYVTHDQAEAMAISDKIAVMKNGRVAPVGCAT